MCTQRPPPDRDAKHSARNPLDRGACRRVHECSMGCSSKACFHGNVRYLSRSPPLVAGAANMAVCEDWRIVVAVKHGDFGIVCTVWSSLRPLMTGLAARVIGSRCLAVRAERGCPGLAGCCKRARAHGAAHSSLCSLGAGEAHTASSRRERELRVVFWLVPGVQPAQPQA